MSELLAGLSTHVPRRCGDVARVLLACMFTGFLTNISGIVNAVRKHAVLFGVGYEDCVLNVVITK